MSRSALLFISDRVLHSGDSTHVTSCQHQNAELDRYASGVPALVEGLLTFFASLKFLSEMDREATRSSKSTILPRVRQADQQSERVYILRIRLVLYV